MAQELEKALRDLEIEDHLIHLLRAPRVRKVIYRIVYEEQQRLGRSRRLQIDPDAVMRMADEMERA